MGLESGEAQTTAPPKAMTSTVDVAEATEADAAGAANGAGSW
ncbi:MAG: hypothetical protein ABSF33_06080 [Acidimicrobiales bacterium]